MATELVMPRLSDTMETGTVAKWHKQEGDRIQKGETIAEIETDKANMEMEAFVSGILARILVEEGKSIGLGEPIAILAADEEEARKIRSGDAPSVSDTRVELQAAPTPESTQGEEGDGVSHDEPAQGPPAAPHVDETEHNERIKASPLARRIAQEHGVALTKVAGTGPGGRIIKDDVQTFLRQADPAKKPREQQPATTPSPRPAEQPPTLSQPLSGPGRAPQPMEMSRMQRTIARRMAEARFSKPEFVLTVDVDMTQVRTLLRSVSGVEGAPKVGPNDVLIKAVAAALIQHPEVNAGWESETVMRYGNVNIGNAVAIAGGLVVPVIKNADRKTLGEIARESKDLIARAHAGKLAPSEYENGTFSISNLGMFGIEQFTPIINPPEACIMGVGAIEQRPVVVDGELVVRDRMHLTLACDHRVINGAEGAEFLRTLRRLLENPMLVLL